jgi:hypothetical protein
MLMPVFWEYHSRVEASRMSSQHGDLPSRQQRRRAERIQKKVAQRTSGEGRLGMRINVTSGSLFNGLAIIGTGIAVMLPDQRWIGGLIILVGILAVVFDIKIERGQVEVGTPKSLGKRVREMARHVMTGVAILAVVIGTAWHFWPKSDHLKTPLTLKDLFDTDFVSTSGPLSFNAGIIHSFTNPFDKTKTDVLIQVLSDSASQSRYLAFYIPAARDQFTVCEELANRFQSILSQLDKTATTSIRQPGDSDVFSSNRFPFSGAIYIYTETDFSSEQVVELQRIYRSNGADKITFRGQAWHVLHESDKRSEPAAITFSPLPLNH